MENKYDLTKWLAGEMKQSELNDFQKTPEYITYSKISEYSSQLETPNFDENQLYTNIISSKKETGKIIKLQSNWLYKVAAVLVIGLGLAFGLKNFVSQTVVALNGQKTTFALPDNSEIVLNSGSEINYKKWNWDNNRNLELQGEAYFRVAKGKKFAVMTSLGKVTVLGTQFDVKARKNRLDVTCFEGRVKVNYNNKQIVLTQGQSVTFENEMQIDSKTDAVKPEWIENKIAFIDENLLNILNEIERQYDVSIEMKAQFNGELFTGKIPNDNLDIALQIIATTYHLEPIKISKNKIIFEEK